MNIAHITYQLASQKINLMDLAKQGEFSVAEANVFQRVMGLQMIPRDNHLTIISIMSLLLEKLFLDFPIQKEKIKYFLFSHTAEFVAPFGFHYLKKLIDTFQLSQAKFFAVNTYKCAGPFQLTCLANSIFHHLHQDDFILIATADIVFTNILKMISGSTVLGEAATAVLLQKSGARHRYIDSGYFSCGQYAQGVWGTKDSFLSFQSEYVFQLKKLINMILAKQKLSLSDIQLILPHNVNLISWKMLADDMAIPLNRIYLNNINRTAHCFGSDPWINLCDAISEKRIKPGDYYLLITVGLGATFFALLFQY